MPTADTDRPISASHVVITGLLIVACAAMASLFMIPNASAWFWPTAGVGVLAGAAAMLIPLKKRPE